MHFVLGYELEATGARRKEIVADLQKLLKPYRWALRVNFLFIIQIEQSEDWEKIRTSLTDYSKTISETFRFVMSPIMKGGHYNGILKTGDWDFVNQLSKE